MLQKWDIEQVGVGDLLRKEIQKGTVLGQRAEEVMKAGGALRCVALVRSVCEDGGVVADGFDWHFETALLPDELVLSLVEPELDALRNKVASSPLPSLTLVRFGPSNRFSLSLSRTNKNRIGS